MITTKSISLFKMFQWSWHHWLWLFLLSGTVALLYRFNIIGFAIPWLPVSIVGTAVAFYVGFKK